MAKRLNGDIIEQIKLLRGRGFSIPEISKELSVPKTSVYHHAKNVRILPEHFKEWMGKRGGSTKRMLIAKQKAYEEGKYLIQNLTYREKLLFICALYWGEGSKGDLGLSNTDPELVKVYINGLKELFQVSENDLRISIRIYEDLDRKLCLQFWSDITGVPVNKFVSVNVLRGRKIGKLKYGMCRVRVTKGGKILKKILGINRAFIDIILKNKSNYLSS